MSFEAINRDKWIAEVDLALAALRRVIVRAIDAAPAKPQTVLQTIRAAMPKPATREIPESLERIPASGIEIDTESGVVRFRGASVTLTRRQAQLAAVLAKVSPNFVSRDYAISRAWPDMKPTSRETSVASTIAALAYSLPTIKIKAEALRGYGLRLWAMQEGE